MTPEPSVGYWGFFPAERSGLLQTFLNVPALFLLESQFVQYHDKALAVISPPKIVADTCWFCVCSPF